MNIFARGILLSQEPRSDGHVLLYTHVSDDIKSYKLVINSLQLVIKFSKLVIKLVKIQVITSYK